MPVSKKQQASVHKYVRENYDRMELTMPKGKKEIIKAAAERQGESLNGYVVQAVDMRMELDNAEGDGVNATDL